MHAADLGFRQALEQPVLAVFVHQEADRAAVHAVDRDAIVHEPVQCLQHQAVAAKRDDGVRAALLDGPIAGRKALKRVLRLRHVTRHERDVVEFIF